MRRMYATIAGPPNAVHPNRRNDANSRNDVVAGVVVVQDGSLVVAPAFIF
jgi:hypothetical protein